MGIPSEINFVFFFRLFHRKIKMSMRLVVSGSSRAINGISRFRQHRTWRKNEQKKNGQRNTKQSNDIISSKYFDRIDNYHRSKLKLKLKLKPKPTIFFDAQRQFMSNQIQSISESTKIVANSFRTRQF